MRFVKVAIASYAAAVGVGIASTVIGAMLFGFENVDPVIKEYALPILGILTLILFPVMNRHLK
jgi:hypothetical protein